MIVKTDKSFAALIWNLATCRGKKLAAMNSLQQSISFHFLSSMNMKIFSRVYLSLIGYLLLDQQPGHVGLNEMRGSAISQLELSTSFRKVFTIFECSLELLHLESLHYAKQVFMFEHSE